jgi:hypothetical protein
VIKPLLKVLNMLGAVVITFSNLLGSQPFWIVERGRFFFTFAVSWFSCLHIRGNAIVMMTIKR